MLLACLLGASACAGNQPRLTIGSIISLTGSISSAGENHLEAIQLAVDEINAGGGILGRTVALVNADDRSVSTFTTAAAKMLMASSGTSAIVGAISSDSTLAALQATAPQHVVLISGSATSPALTGASPYFFRACPSDALQGQLLAKRAVAEQLQRVAVIYIPGAYGADLAGTFVSNFTALGGTITFNQMLTPGQPSYMSLLGDLFATNPEGVLLVAYPVDDAQVIRDYNTAYAFHHTTWFFTDSAQDDSFVADVGASNFTFAHEGTATPSLSGPQYPAFAAAFATRWGVQPEGFSANFYDATYLVALAMQDARASDGPSVRAHLRNIADPPGMVIHPGQWAQARTALTMGGKVNYDGASGTVDVDANGDVIATYDIWKVIDGKITSVERGVLP
jgi:ABC-type branched-subunit amino acid transport system substrate-binding protein